jgi:hypothetical protein
MSGPQWDLPDGEGIQPCMRPGCRIQKREYQGAIEWRRGKRGTWRAFFTLANCTGTAAAPKPVARKEGPLKCTGPGCQNRAEGGRVIYQCDEYGADVCSDCSENFGENDQGIRCADGNHVNKMPPPAPGRMTDEEFARKVDERLAVDPPLYLGALNIAIQEARRARHVEQEQAHKFQQLQDTVRSILCELRGASVAITQPPDLTNAARLIESAMQRCNEVLP